MLCLGLIKTLILRSKIYISSSYKIKIITWLIILFFNNVSINFISGHMVIVL